MRLESYAQEFEDLFLYSILHDVREGFYIDVGANDPTYINVTRFFYDRGWHGINIEPIPQTCRMLEESRPRDINLCIGVGAEHGEAFLYGNNVMATFSDAIAKSSFKDVRTTDGKKLPPEVLKSKTPTEIMTLTEIFRSYCSPNQQIHFCKIDVEGFEREVLLGVEDWNEFRPWIFCIESTFPGTENPTFEDWEYILLEHNYQLAFAHGINRYYVDSRHKHLAQTPAEIGNFLRQFEIRRMEMSSPIKFA